MNEIQSAAGERGPLVIGERAMNRNRREAAGDKLTVLRRSRCCQMMAAIAMKTDTARRAGAKASKPAKRTRPKKRAANKSKGGGGPRTRKPRHAQLDSDAEKNSPIAANESSANASPHIGRINIGNRTIATFQTKTKNDYERVKDVIEAGFRVKHEAMSWGMNPDHYWQLQHFPSDHADWQARVERLASHSLHDDDASDMGSLMHACTWTLEPLWKWMHHLAEHAKNSNIKNEAGRVLGALYHEARQKKNRDRLGDANEEFERKVAPFGASGQRPSAALQQWVSNRMRHCMELWKRAIEVAIRFENMKTPERRHPFARVTIVDDVYHHYERLPMNSMKEAWEAYFIQERTEEGTRLSPSASWRTFLNELEAHPLCTRSLTLAHLTNFEACWSAALEPVLRQEWAALPHDKRQQIATDDSFEHRIGTAEDPKAGYWVAKDYFNHIYIPYWENKKDNDAAFWKSFNTRKPGKATAVDPVATRVLAAASRKKSRAG